jgi:hypothetical protein
LRSRIRSTIARVRGGGRRAAGGVAALIAAAAAACTFKSPFDDPEGHLGPAPTVDGSVRPFDAAFEEDDADAACSARAEDLADAVADGATTDAAAGSPCDASFCDDFDDGPLGAMWTQIQQPSSAGTLALVDAGRSAPLALSAKTYGGELDYRSVELAKYLGNAKTASCALAVKPLERPGRPAVFFFRGLTTSSEIWQAWIALAATETTLGLAVFSKDGGAPFEAIAPANVAPVDEWTELLIETDLEKVTLRVGGAPAVELTVPEDVAIGGGGMSAHIGLQVIETTREIVLFDDVRCVVAQ